MYRQTLDDVLSGMSRGGMASSHERDGLPGLGYLERFDASQLGRSGNPVIRTFFDRDHYDVMERNAVGDTLHHRIYRP